VVARADHWDAAYSTRGVEGVSWYQAVPETSLELVDALDIRRDAAVIDVGGGAAFLVDELLTRGYRDVTVLDLSASALEATRRRLPPDASVQFVQADLLEWDPDRRYDLWHDRAVFHFLVSASDRDRYLATLKRAVEPGGKVIVGTFAEDGPEMCSGLPVSRYSASDLAAALGDAFDVLETRRERHVTPRGAVQPFTWVAGVLSAEGTSGSNAPIRASVRGEANGH
jgi:SAM-dependent methyltransferase